GGGPKILAGDTVRIWDVETGKELAVFSIEAVAGNSFSLVFAPDGKWLAAGVGRRTAHIWDLATKKEVIRLKGGANPDEELPAYRTCALAFTSDKRRLLTGGVDGVVRVWDLLRGKEERCFRVTNEAVHALAISPDGKLLAIAAGDRRWVHLLNLTTGKDVLGRAGHTASICGVGFSGNQKLRSLSSEEVCEWEPATGKLLSRHFLAALADLPFPILALGPSGRLFAIKAWEKELGLLDVATGKVSWSPLAVKHLPRLSKFTPAGKRAVFIDEELPTDDWVRVWDLLRNTEVRKFPMHGNQITCVAISHDGKRVASGHNDPLVLVWDVTTGKRLFRLPCGTGGSDAHELALSSDGALLAAACRDKVIRLWALNSGKELHHLAGYRREGFVPCLIFAPDNRSIVLGGRASGTVQIWEVCTGRERCHFDGHRARVWCL